MTRFESGKPTGTQEKPTQSWRESADNRYQWLLRGNGLTVSDTSYFVYCNGRRNSPRFDARVEFDISIISYVGHDAWIEQCIVDAHQCLMSNLIPEPTQDCDYCIYQAAVTDVVRPSVQGKLNIG